MAIFYAGKMNQSFCHKLFKLTVHDLLNNMQKFKYEYFLPLKSRQAGTRNLQLRRRQ